MAPKLNVAILIYPGFELVDMNGPTDVFVKTNRYNNNRYHVFTLSETAAPVLSERDVVNMKPDYSFADCPQPDIIVLPGQIMPAGSSTTYGSGSLALIRWLNEQALREGVIFMSVCVGAYILAHSGLLDHKNATTHWAALESIQTQYPDITFIRNVRYVADGNFITTGGVTSGIDGALYLVGKLDGEDIATEVANIMVYNTEAPLPPGTLLPPTD